MVSLLAKPTEKFLIPDFVSLGVTEFEQSFSRVFYLMATAFTLPEVEMALAAAREHEAQFHTQGGEYSHGFHHTIEAAKLRAREAQEMGLSPEQIYERNNLLRSLIWFGPTEEAYDLTRLNALRERLTEWLSNHPADPSAIHALEIVTIDLEVAAMLNPAP